MVDSGFEQRGSLTRVDQIRFGLRNCGVMNYINFRYDMNVNLLIDKVPECWEATREASRQPSHSPEEQRMEVIATSSWCNGERPERESGWKAQLTCHWPQPDKERTSSSL
ncbi:uncharacterized protein [Panulirus ornatus]|uniref:uncharacterized protein n=1 Tax=Panulirus ornatus TaxID=150431 RepID=UPI003A86C031